MFYSQSLLSRKGPLGRIWMAAYCFKKLRRDQIAGTDISSSIDKIHSEAQMSYRVLAQLLLGIVRIFSWKVEYLYKDYKEVLTHISHWAVPKEPVSKHRPGIVAGKEVIRPSNRNAIALEKEISDEAVETMRAPHHHVTITAPNRFELDAFELEDMDEGDIITKPQEQSMIPDELTQENYEVFFLNEREAIAHTEFNSACFTPTNDVLPSDMMDIDIDLEISEFCNSTFSEGRIQEPQEDFWHLVEFGNHEGLGARKSLDPGLHDEEPQHQAHLSDLPEIVPSDNNEEIRAEEPEKQKRPQKLCVEKISDHEKTPDLTEGHWGAIAQAKKTSNKSSSPSHAGFASPKFTVATPAKREQLKIFRKRKGFFDESVVLSTETLRQMINDARSLVCKRRKLPHTILDAWKSCRITNFQNNFMDPLIPFISPDLKALFQKGFSNHASSRITSDSRNQEINIQDIHSKMLNFKGTVQKTSVETPAPASHYEVSATSKSDEVTVKESSLVETSDTGSDLMDLELGSLEKSSNDQDDGWPLRTRAVAQYMHNWFLNSKEREQNGMLSFTRILEGKTRTKCARYFYEILALKDRGCIDVEQDSPYDDIIISPTPELEAMFKNQESILNR